MAAQIKVHRGSTENIVLLFVYLNLNSSTGHYWHTNSSGDRKYHWHFKESHSGARNQTNTHF